MTDMTESCSWRVWQTKPGKERLVSHRMKSATLAHGFMIAKMKEFPAASFEVKEEALRATTRTARKGGLET